MIIRIVKMTFESSKVTEFQEFTKKIAGTISGFEGCTYLRIYQDIHTPNIFFSYSHWNAETDLNNYRNSEFFKKTWQKTKQWFSAKPEAWSVHEIKPQNTTL